MNLFKQDLLAYKPIVICHRGLCSIFPENTLQSLEAALTRCDLIQFDILLTKDRQVIVFHDRHLSQITNIKQFQHFKDRKNSYYDNLTTIQENSVPSQDWWVKEFNLQQLKTLNIIQRYPQRPQLSKHSFTIPTLQQAFQQIFRLKEKLKDNNCGFLIEIKPLKQYENDPQDNIIVQKLIQILQKFELNSKQKSQKQRFPIVLQSFNLNIVKKLNQSKLDLPIVALLDSHIVVDQTFVREQLTHNIIGIGISQAHAKKQIVNLCAHYGKKVLFWSMIDDKTDKLPIQFTSFREAYFYLFSLGINGIITQFPQNCQRYFQAYQSKKQRF